ncbi:MAG TPA: hypothetical protein VNJ04_10580 [Gemmatimonadaceae bacterium]|nr:hypothetical protein [Gemmatimonadaceae bacterium]
MTAPAPRPNTGVSLGAVRGGREDERAGEDAAARVRHAPDDRALVLLRRGRVGRQQNRAEDEW